MSQYHCIDLFVRVPLAYFLRFAAAWGSASGGEGEGGGPPGGVPVGLGENSGGGRGVRGVESGGVSDMSPGDMPGAVAWIIVCRSRNRILHKDLPGEE